jgi:hypothetical protein
MPNLVEIVIAVVLALLGREGIGVFLAARSQAKRNTAEAEKAVAEAEKAVAEASVLSSTTEWSRLISTMNALQEENARLVRRMCAVELSETRHAMEVQTLRLGVVILISQLRAAGIEPAWEPTFPDMTSVGGDGHETL